MPNMVTFYFNNYDIGGEEWANDPEQMCDGDDTTISATNIVNDVEKLTSNSYTPQKGNVTKVEIRAKGTTVIGATVALRPIFNDGDGDNHNFNLTGAVVYSSWYDITNDTNSPSTWTWNDVQNLDCDVELTALTAISAMIYIVEVRISYRAENTCGSCDRFSIIGDSHTVELKMPIWGGEDGAINKDLHKFSFWSENYDIHDDGIASQPFTLSGIETAGCADELIGEACFPWCFPVCFHSQFMKKFSNLWEMMDKHEEFEISGLGDCIDAIYKIRSLDVNTVPRHGKYYLLWRLSLEKVRDS